MPLLSGFEATPPTVQQQLDFHGHVLSLTDSAAELHYMYSDDFEGVCSGKGSGYPGDDKLALVYVMRGRILSRYKGDIDTVTEAGQFLLFDAHRPHRMRFQQPQFVQVNLPRAYLQPVLRDNPVPSQISRAVSRSGLARLLAMQMREFPALSAQLSPYEQQGLLHATEALASRILENSCLQGSWHHHGRYQGLYVAAIRYMRLHLDRVTLSATNVAAALGCSRATLYRAFAEHSQHPADYIRELRLQALASLLQNARNTQPIAQLAMRCGLSDATNLSRLFRQRFGMTPREFRVRHQNLN